MFYPFCCSLRSLFFKGSRLILGVLFLAFIVSCQPDQKFNTYPTNGANNINTDVQLRITFESRAILGNSGVIRVFNAQTGEMVDSLDMSIPPGPRNTRTPAPYDTLKYAGVPDSLYTVYYPDTDTTHVYQINQIGGNTVADQYHFFPVLLDSNTATIFLHSNKLQYGRQYYVTIDAEVFPLVNGTFTGITGKTDWQFQTKSAPPSDDKNKIVVSGSGDGDFNTVQGALDFVKPDPGIHKTIYIKNGVYEEMVYFRDKQNLTIIGESRESVIIRYPNNGVFNFKHLSPDPKLAHLYHNIRSVFSIESSSDINLMNLTIISVGEKPAQAEGLLVKGERIQVHQVTIIGSGDALQSSGTVYYDNISMKGFGDNILGYGALFLNQSEFISTYGPHMWIRNPKENHGNVFVDCIFRFDGEGETTIARTNDNGGGGFPYCEAVLINCKLHGITAEGWSIKGKAISDIHYWEYNSTNLADGTPVDMSERNPISRRLTMETDSIIISNYSNPSFVLEGWTPLLAPQILSEPNLAISPKGKSASLTVLAAAMPYPDYQWFKNGTLIEGATNSELRLPSSEENYSGSYHVEITNELGSIKSESVKL